MKKYLYTFLGISLLSISIVGCNAPSEKSKAQSSKEIDLEFSKAQADVAALSSELTATSETTTITTTTVSSSTIESSTESQQPNSTNSSSVIQETSSTSVKETLPSKKETDFEINAKKYPADSVATFKGDKFKGMKYSMTGKVLTKANADSVGGLIESSYIVENDRGYRMLVTPPYEVEIPDGVTLEVEGVLNGKEYDLESLGLSNLNKNAGLINATTLIINGKTLGIDYFSPSDL
ncbi:hypothetical protein PF972_001035 [Enterococcus faecalis]|nr:hypothetical protein [Enterococcus faecalis]